jgi:hypothetical protein
MKVTCPKCGSDQLSSNKKGFSGGKAVAGAVLTGGIGLLAGIIGSSKVVCTCLACGNQFKAGQGKVIYDPDEQAPAVAAEPAKLERNKRINKITLTVFAAIVLLIILLAALSK